MILWSCFAWGKATPPKNQVVLFCYPSDELIEQGCNDFEKQMKDCGHKVLRRNDPSKEEAAAFFKELDDDTIPLFVSSHGNSFGQKHYLDSNKGDLQRKGLGPTGEWLGFEGKPGEIPTEDEFPESARYFETLPILKTAGNRTKVLSACFSGQACEQSKLEPILGGLIASCQCNETCQHMPIKGELHQEPVLYWMGQLYCDPALFSEVDGSSGEKKDGVLTPKELGGFLSQKMGGKKTIRQAFVSSPLNTNKALINATQKFTTYWGDQIEFKYIPDDKDRNVAIETIVKEQAANPDTKTRIRELGKLYRLSVSDPKSFSIMLPGMYSRKILAESSAKEVMKQLKADNTIAPSATFTLSEAGTATGVEIESLVEPCRIGGFGIPQTPLIEHGLRSRTHEVPK